MVLVLIISTIILFGVVSYAFFSANLQGNVDKNNVVQTTGTLRIEYIEGPNIDAQKIRPGWSGTKKLSVKNTGTLVASYDLLFENVQNNFINKEDLTYEVRCESSLSGNACGTLDENYLPGSTIQYQIFTEIKIKPNEIHDYEIEITYKETGVDQSADIGSNFSGKVNILESGSYSFTKIMASTAGEYYSLAITDQGTLYGWGQNNYGQLGDGSYEIRMLPKQIVIDATFQVATAKYNHSLAIDESGNLYTWGYNNDGQLSFDPGWNPINVTGNFK